MFFFLYVDKYIKVKVFRRRKIFQDINSVGDKLLGVVVVGEIDIFTVVFPVFKKLMIVKSGIVSVVEI